MSVDTAVYMVTHGNVEQTKKTIELIHKTSGCPYHLYVADSGSGNEMVETLLALKDLGRIYNLQIFADNVGQNMATNAILDEIFSTSDNSYEWIVCWSPDVIPKTRRLLKKLVRAMRTFKMAGVEVVASPAVSGGENFNQITLTGDDVGFPYCEVELVNGYLRGVPAGIMRTWRYNVYGAISYGESRELKDYTMTELNMSHVCIQNLQAKHLGGPPDIYKGHIGYGIGL